MPTITPLQQAYSIIEQLERKIASNEDQPIAIVGMSCRFPGANNVLAYWQMLIEGQHVSEEVPKFRWDMQEYYSPVPATPGKIYSPRAAFVDGVDQFAADFFDVSPREASSMDPQHRLLLELSWEAFEDAAIPPESLISNQCGVFVGIGQNDYSMRKNNIEDIDVFDGIGNGFCFAAGRIAHSFALNGPTMSIDTACSSSLVSLHMACQSLRAGECNISLVGGTQLMLAPESSVYLSQSRALTSSDYCKPFDEEANGFMRGEGCGVVILKRLSDAQRDGDNIIAVIKSSAINHDGPSSGLTVPNGSAQQEVIKKALQQGKIDPNTISYIETHGTGTSLGDPIEAEAIIKTYCQNRDDVNKLQMRSVKANIGHLEAASGMAGLIKCALSLNKAVIPQQIHFNKGNSHINWDAPIEVAIQNIDWQATNAHPNRAAVSAFGLSGSNAHIILEQAPATVAESKDVMKNRKADVLLLSAKSTPEIMELAAAHYQYLQTHNGSLSEYCRSANMGRQVLSHKVAFAVDSMESLQLALKAYVENQKAALVTNSMAEEKAIAFVFTGQGSQYSGMGYQLYKSEPVFNDIMNKCQQTLIDTLDVPLLEVMFSPKHSQLLNQTLYTQPALFAIEYALAKLWESWGITPTMVMGHSVGEIAAACFAGVMSLDDGLFLIAKRAKLISQLPADGGMAAVFADAKTCEDKIQSHPKINIAAYNTPKMNVIAGPIQDLETLYENLDSCNIRYQQLTVSHAFHSALMEPILDEFEAAISEIKFSPPQIAMISNLDGKPLNRNMDAKYWRSHIRMSVQFCDSIKTVANDCKIIIEIGPNPVLTTMGKSCIADNNITFLNSLSSKDKLCLYKSLAALSLEAEKINWENFYHKNDRPCSLPKYPFKRESYWPESLEHEPKSESTYALSWKKIAQDSLRDFDSSSKNYLIFGGCSDWQLILKNLLMQSKSSVQVLPASNTCQAIEQLKGKWVLLTLPDEAEKNPLQAVKNMTFEVSQIILKLRENKLLEGLAMFTNGAQYVQQQGCSEQSNIQQSIVWGFWRCLALEIPDITCGIYDLDNSSPNNTESQFRTLIQCYDSDEKQIVLRDGSLYVPRLTRRDTKISRTQNKVSSEGSYLITGGLGGIAHCVTEWLVEMGAKDLILCGRRAESELKESEHIDSLRKQGIQVSYQQLDITDEQSLKNCLKSIDENNAPLKGIIHTAGIIEQGLISELTEDHFINMLKPKLEGTWLLHKHTEKYALDLFVCFSSLSSYTGSTRLSYYAAANAFQDAFTNFRRQRGLSAQTINWGPWGDRGMMLNNQAGLSNLAAAGISQLTADTCSQPFKDLLNSDNSHAIICTINWQKFNSIIHSTAFSTFYNEYKNDCSLPTETTGIWVLTGYSDEQATKAVTDAFLEDLAECLQANDIKDINIHESFNSLGVSSLIGVELCEKLSKTFETTISVISLYQYPTAAEMIENIKQKLLQNEDQNNEDHQIITPHDKNDAIAIVGLNCRFPEAANPDEFWKMLIEGKSAIKTVERQSWLKSSNKTKAALLDNPYTFDPLFFGISPKEALAMDPLQRQFMEVAWGALEQSGYGGDRLCRQTGIFVGVEQSSYAEHFLGGQFYQRIKQQIDGKRFNMMSKDMADELLSMLREQLEPAELVADAAAGIGLNEIASRLSHFLNMSGPSLTLNSACSSSLVALEQAVTQLRNGQIEMAMVGGINLCLSDTVKSILDKAGALSPSGNCSPFDDSADGMVLGEGVGVVILKPLLQAQKDGDYIYSVIREVSLNNDGHSQGITVPNPEGQAQCISKAYKNSGINPNSVSYVECHGTGTPLGDPIEIQSMSQVFKDTSNGRYRIGSVKSSIGHMLAASGMGGLIKLCLMFKNQKLVPTVNYKILNKHIDLKVSPFNVQDSLEEWSNPQAEILRAGLNSFGFGGTNAHVILEQAPPRIHTAETPMPGALLLQATSSSALINVAKNVLQAMEGVDNFAHYFAVINRNQRRQKHKLAIPIVSPDQVKDCLQIFIKDVDRLYQDDKYYFVGHCHVKIQPQLIWVNKQLSFPETECQNIAKHYPVFAKSYDENSSSPDAGGLALAALFNSMGIKFTAIAGAKERYFKAPPFAGLANHKEVLTNKHTILAGELKFEKLQKYIAAIAAMGVQLNVNTGCSEVPQLLTPCYPFTAKEFKIEQQIKRKVAPQQNQETQLDGKKNDELFDEINAWQDTISNQFNQMIEEVGKI
jgi:acyl transferase domain-containing protein/NADP-dependent 3-hydroxy acid dehydrogenase YdfG/acyl carrier protein